MTCQKCGKPNPSVHLTDIIDGKKRVRVLCQECAAELGFVIDPKLIQATTSQLQKLIAPLVAPTPVKPMRTSGEPLSETCPECGMTWEAFREGNRLGCPNDYQVFQAGLDELLSEIHGHNRHRGRMPERVERELSIDEKLLALRTDMEKAVLKEDFERAARLRDEIARLEASRNEDASST